MAPLFLIGFMAAGKTSVGRAIAGATGRLFVDLDEEIGAAGEPVAALVARDEPEFRRREAAVLARLIAASESVEASGLVVATGGGAAAYGDNLARMRAAGCVVALGVDLGEAERRAEAAEAEGASPRPLLAAGRALLARRAPVYRRAHAVVDTTGRSVAEVADAVIAVERAWFGSAQRDATLVALGERSYPVSVTDRIDPRAIRAALGAPSKIAIVTDTTVAQHWGPSLAGLARELSAETVAIPPGEPSKTLATYEQIVHRLVAAGLDRGSAIVALGGGVVGDLAGFVAATLFRGIPVVQVPTTIVAMTDAAIGGKTAVDLPAGKNLVGAFWQPRLVACALETLTTLSGRERRAGFGELWKYALLDGRELWDAVAGCAAWAAGPEATPPPPALRGVIERAIAYKAAIVGRDEREQTGHRALLNLGHTVGHAIESATGMLHGEAVGLGLVAACRVSAHVAGSPPERERLQQLEREVVAALDATGLASELDPHLTDDVLARLAVDKKRIGANLRFVVIRDVGTCEPLEIAVSELRRILRADPAA